MRLSRFLLIKGVITFLFGILFLLLPAGTMSLFGVTLEQVGVFMTRYFGVAMIGIGLICLIEKNKAFHALEGILLSLFITDTIGFVVALQAQLSGLLNALGWFIVLIWLLLALGLGYFRFFKAA